MLLLHRETIVQSLSTAYLYLFIIATIDYVDYIFWIAASVSIYYEFCFWGFEGIEFSFNDNVI